MMARAWTRFLAPYYVLNALALLSYAGLRELFWNHKMVEREGFLNLPRVRARASIRWHTLKQ